MTRDVVNEVRDRLDIVDIVGQTVSLKKAGRNFKGLCPFHQEKTPSFIVFPDSQNFHCFGCGKGGDAFTFLMLTQNLDFREALTELAERVGVPLESGPTAAPGADQRRQRMRELHEQAARFYSNILHESRHGEAGRAFLAQRNIDQATARRFQLGYAPQGWDSLTRYLADRGADLQLAAEGGLLQTRDSGGYYDRFRHRFLFPIRDREGGVIGFGGRAIGDEQPKYLNSPQTDIFDKSRVLFALDLAREAIKAEDSVVIVEGYMDALTAHQFGFANVVAAMGTAVTESQVDQLKRFTKRITIALDADAAGELAAMRSIESLHASLETSDHIVPNPVTAFRISKRIDAQIRIAELPASTDPDDVIRSSPDQWSALMNNATPYVDFLIDRVTRDVDLSDATAKRQATQRLAPVLRLIPDEIEQSHYVQLLSRRLDLDYKSVMASITLSAARQQLRSTATPELSTPDKRPVRLEDFLVSIFLQHSADCAEEIESIPLELFGDTRNRLIVEQLRAGTISVPDGIFPEDDTYLMEHASWLQSIQSTRPNQIPGQIREDVRQVIRRIERERHDRLADHLRVEIAAAEQSDDRAALERYAPKLQELAELHKRLYPRPSPYFRDSRDKDLLTGPLRSG